MSAYNLYHHFKSFCSANNIVNNSIEHNIDNNIFFLKTQLFLEEDILYTGKMPISGLSFFYEQQNMKRVPSKTSYKKNQLMVNTVNYGGGNLLLKKGNITSSSITLKKDFLEKNLPQGQIKEKIIESLEANKPGKLIKKDINPQVQHLLNHLYNNPFSNQLDELYLQSKILEIIYLEFKNLIDTQPLKNNQIKFSNQDRDAIYYAKEILMKNISNPPSLKELSYQVKLNEFKLKIGFNRFFNQTPYSISVESRLQEAKKLLEKSELNINEIASKVGYKYSQSFSNAYLKRFGVRPKNMMKSRKYYY